MTPAALPGWVLEPTGGAVRLWRAGRVVLTADTFAAFQAALGPATLTHDRLVRAVAPWFGVAGGGAQALIAVWGDSAVGFWRACLAAWAPIVEWASTLDVRQLPQVDAVWTGSATPIGEPLWCTAAAAGVPLVWVPCPVDDPLALLPGFSDSA